jgi:hypothetical protein
MNPKTHKKQKVINKVMVDLLKQIDHDIIKKRVYKSFTKPNGKKKTRG